MKRVVLVCLVLLVAREAAAWKAGPVPFERNVDFWDVAVRGRVAKVDVVDKKPGGWVLSRATLDVERAYRGLAGAPKQHAFYFWSATDGEMTLAHTLAANDRILVFLSANLDPVKGMKTDPAVKHMLQFGKAAHRGYLYALVDKAGTATLRDGVIPGVELTLADAEARLAKRKP